MMMDKDQQQQGGREVQQRRGAQRYCRGLTSPALAFPAPA
jgi:hypothetical protein